MTGVTRQTMSTTVDVDGLVTAWNAANYLTVAQIYLQANPLLREPLLPEHIKPRLLGHWGTSPGLNLIYAQLNRLIRERDCDVLYVTGPGHGRPHASARDHSDQRRVIGNDTIAECVAAPAASPVGRRPGRRERDEGRAEGSRPGGDVAEA
jgi:hypothetical protein